MSDLPQKLQIKVSEALDYMTDRDGDPTQLLKEAAEKYGLNEELVRLTGRTFNLGAYMTHRKEAKDAEEIASAFPIADPEQVVREMFSVKQAECNLQPTGISPEYTARRGDDASWYTRYQDRVRLAKQASVVKEATAQAVVEPIADDNFETRFEKWQRLKDASELAKSKRIDAEIQFGHSMRKLAHYFDRGGSKSLGEVYNGSVACFGPKGAVALAGCGARPKEAAMDSFQEGVHADGTFLISVPLGSTTLANTPEVYAYRMKSIKESFENQRHATVESISLTMPDGRQLATKDRGWSKSVSECIKDAETRLDAPMPTHCRIRGSLPEKDRDVVIARLRAIEKEASELRYDVDTVVDPLNEPYSLVESAIKAAGALKQASDRYESAQRDLWRFWPEIAPKSYSPFLDFGIPFEKEADWAQAALANKAMEIAGRANEMVNSSVEGVGDRQLSMVDELNDPRHMQMLNGIRAAANLNELLAHDPVISGYKPDRIAQAYNQLASLAPRAATQPLAAQALLRQALTQGALDPAQLKQLGDLEQYAQKSSPSFLGSESRRSHDG